MTDISKWKNTESVLLLTVRKLDLLNQVIQHDTINTISGIFGLVDMAVSVEDKDQHEAGLVQIRELTRTIQSQIAFIRDYQEVGVHSPAWQNIRETIHQSFAVLSHEDIILTIDGEDVEIFADLLLIRVFVSLARNATRPGETVTKIRFTTEESANVLTIIYEDNGQGVPAGKKEEIFKRGYDHTTGSGLFLAREILALTGIAIRETGEPGKGTRFGITVPAGACRVIGR